VVAVAQAAQLRPTHWFELDRIVGRAVGSGATCPGAYDRVIDQMSGNIAALEKRMAGGDSILERGMDGGLHGGQPHGTNEPPCEWDGYTPHYHQSHVYKNINLSLL